MAFTPIGEKIYAAIPGHAPLANLLTNDNGQLRVWDVQLREGSAFPALVLTGLASKPTYCFGGRLSSTWETLTFEIWDEDPDRMRRVVEPAIYSFLDQFAGASGLPGAGAQPNYFLTARDGWFAQTQPQKCQRIIDVKLWNLTTI